jgi:hypothetical protein
MRARGYQPDSPAIRAVAKRPVGHPTHYAAELAALACRSHGGGAYDEEAAALERISAGCLTNWRKSNPELYGTIKWAEAKRRTWSRSLSSAVTFPDHADSMRCSWEFTWTFASLWPASGASPSEAKPREFRLYGVRHAPKFVANGFLGG